MIEIDSGYLRGVGIVCPTHKLEIKERKMTELSVDSDEFFGKKLNVYDNKMTEIEKTEGEIKVLQAKLELLKEMEKHKSPVEEAYKRVYGNYPDTGICNGMSYAWWDVFCKGYNEAHRDAVENNKNFEPTPQTPEQVEQGLRDAMKKAKEDAVFEKPKPKTLYGVIYEWKYDTYDPTCEDLVNMIEEWLPDDEIVEDEDYEMGWNDALRTIKEKLR